MIFVNERKDIETYVKRVEFNNLKNDSNNKMEWINNNNNVSNYELSNFKINVNNKKVINHIELIDQNGNELNKMRFIQNKNEMVVCNIINKLLEIGFRFGKNSEYNLETRKRIEDVTSINIEYI